MQDIVRDTSPESLARLNEANLAAGFSGCARAYGGEVHDEPDLLWCGTGLPSAGWNRVPRAQLELETLDNRIDWVVERARTLHVPFLWQIGPSTRPVGLGDHLLRHGFNDAGVEPAMGVALAELPTALSLPPGATVELVRDKSSLERWARTFCAGFEVPASSVEAHVAGITRDNPGDAAAAHYYIAYLHGDPVATSAMNLAAGVAGIFAVSTLPAARRQGIGAAVTMAPLLDARTRGYYVGVLEATEMGYPVYARMGFSEQFRYGTFLWRPDSGVAGI